MPVDVEVLGRQVGVRVQDFQSPLQGQAGDGLSLLPPRNPGVSLIQSTQELSTTASPAPWPGLLQTAVASLCSLPTWLQHPEEALAVEQGTELGRR